MMVRMSYFCLLFHVLNVIRHQIPVCITLRTVLRAINMFICVQVQWEVTLHSTSQVFTLYQQLDNFYSLHHSSQKYPSSTLPLGRLQRSRRGISMVTLEREQGVRSL